MEIIKHDTAKKIKYFDLFDFIEKIKLSPKVLEHMEDTNKNFDQYFRKLSKFEDRFVLYFWASMARDEVWYNQAVENHKFKDFDFNKISLFFDSFDIDHDRIHDVHRFVMKDENDSRVGKYRRKPVRVSRVCDGKEEIFWYGANPRDIKKFMDKLIEFYKSRTSSVIDSNPFIKGSLVHLLLAKIQPYYDGNRRTARMIQNIKFTEIINEIYDMDLRVSPVNLSESIKLNILSYTKSLNETHLDIDYDNNEIINYWLDVMLNMYDEQLFKIQGIIDNMDDNVEKILDIKDTIDYKWIDSAQGKNKDVAKILDLRSRLNLETREQLENMKIRKRKR